ncbi:MAG: sugar phosphate isomerase/epimerase, partial [Clostridia bacterium]|nr:sugar phosphate isomerase/epimerase [Clostridia bacterium]
IMAEGDDFYGDDHLSFAKELKKVADECGIFCNQSHAPYPSYIEGDEEFNKNAFKANIKALEITAALGGKVCVVHPSNYLSAKENADRIYAPLIPYCEKFGVKVATENIWQWTDNGHDKVRIPCTGTLPDGYEAILDALRSPYFGACLDVGHANMFGDLVSPEKLLKAGGDRVLCLHVHDNDLLNDNHIMPFLGKIDWASFMKVLKESGYTGDFTFEADMLIFKLPKELATEAEKLLCKAGRYLLNL